MLRPLAVTLVVAGLLFGPSPRAGVWDDLTPAAGPAPDPRTKATAIYDPVGHRMVVFGGQAQGVFFDDVWAFDLETFAWADLTPATGSPPGRLTPNAVYDAVEHELLMWAGQGPSGFFNDVWSFELDAGVWTEFTPPEPMPNLRYGTVSVFDPVARELVTFAGFTFQGRFDDTWRFDPDADAWTDVSPAVGPHERCLHAASYDVRGHRMVMFGGQRSGALNDTWTFDLTTDLWTELTPEVSPPGRYFAAKAYDAARHRSLIFGGDPGDRDDVWAFDLDTATWSEITPAAAGPSGREGATGVYVASMDALIVFGGSFNNDVWALRFSNPGEVAFPAPIVSDGSSFSWPVPVNVDFVRGDLGSVASLPVDVTGTRTHATSFPADGSPAPGQGWFYLARVRGSDGSWQSSHGNEPQRDTLLP